MQIWLTQDGVKFRLPINPDSLEVSTGNINTTVDIINLGEMNIIGKPSLSTLSLSSFFPSKNYSFNQYKNIKTPLQSVRLIESFKSNPIRVIISKLNVNMLMTIEAFSYSLQDATGDIYYTIELKEYKATSNKNKLTNISGTKATTRPTKTVKQSTYVVKKGDNLYNIAKKYTGDFNNWEKLQKINNIADPLKLQIGKKLIIKV